MSSDNDVVKEYVSGLSDNDLQSLHTKFKQQLCGDQSSIANQLAQNAEMDRWLAAAPSATAWFDMIDEVAEAVAGEHSNRFSSEEGK